MADTVVDRLHHEFGALVTHLDQGAETSLRNTAEETFRKALLLSAASYFETRITEILIKFARDSTHPATPLPEFIRIKALSRQFHTLFDWERNNANRFFSLFGAGFKAHMETALKADPAMDDAVKAFMEVGAERNRLVHGDYGAFPLEKTAGEIFDLFTNGLKFVDGLRPFLDEFVESERAKAAQPGR